MTKEELVKKCTDDVATLVECSVLNVIESEAYVLIDEFYTRIISEVKLNKTEMQKIRHIYETLLSSDFNEDEYFM